MIVDDCWVSVGSTNFDNRSFRLNDEANINVFDRGFAREQARILPKICARSKPVGLEEWRRRPITERLEELVGRMMRHQLVGSAGSDLWFWLSLNTECTEKHEGHGSFCGAQGLLDAWAQPPAYVTITRPVMNGCG